MDSTIRPGKRPGTHRKPALVSAFTLPMLTLCTCLQGEEQQGMATNLGVSVLHDDNVLNQSSALSDSALTLQPEFAARNNFGKHRFKFGYSGDYTAYANETDLNYNTHKVGTEFLFDHTQRINSEFALKYQKARETPGSTNASTDSLTDFIFYQRKEASGKLIVGTNQSIGQIIGHYEHNSTRYDDGVQQFRDFDRNALTATFFYRIAPKTRLLLETTHADYDYIKRSQFGDQSSKDTRYLGGIEWDLANKTTGIVKIGHQERDYDADYFEPISSLYYSLDMIWRPKTYSRLTLSAGRQNRESAQPGYAGNRGQEIGDRPEIGDRK